jgi:hypothetical protein
VGLLIEYIEHCLEIAQTLVAEGDLSEQRLTELKIAGGFQDWELPQAYQTNVRFLCERLSKVR